MSHTPANDEKPLRILYCRCAYADVVPEQTKDDVLEKLCASGAQFDSVADLCEMSARRDPALKSIAEQGNVKIAACYDRAVRGLFRAADAPIDDANVRVLNMRTEDAETIAADLLDETPPTAGAAEDAAANDEDDGKEGRARESA